MIIGIAGTIGAGKGTVVEVLKQRGFYHVSISSILRDMLSSQGKHQTRSDMSSLAESLLALYPGGVFSIALKRARDAGAADVVIEAVHRPSEAAFLRQHGAKILGVDAPIELRFERTHKRADGEKDQVTFEQFVEHSKREDEGEGKISSNIRAVLKSADALIMNDADIRALNEHVVAALGAIAVTKS